MKELSWSVQEEQMPSSEVLTPSLNKSRPARISQQEAWRPVTIPSFSVLDPKLEEESAETEEERQRRSTAEMARQMEASWHAGREIGRKEGLSEAAEKFRQEEQQHGMTVRARAGALLADYDAGLKKIKEDLAHEVLTLALTVAERIACEHVVIAKDALESVLAESMTHISDRYRYLEISVNPSDVERAQQWFTANHPEITVKVLPATRISVGGCTLAAGSTRIDSQLETRVRRAFAAIGMKEVHNASTRHHPSDCDDTAPPQQEQNAPADHSELQKGSVQPSAFCIDNTAPSPNNSPPTIFATD